jgi:uncharacterized membrane protein YhaH (DUF805 family)
MFTLINLIISVILSLLIPIVGWPTALLCSLYNLAVIIPGLAVAVRRLHDTNRSGWWLLISIIPIVDLILLVFLVQASQPGPNAYAAQPRAVTE